MNDFVWTETVPPGTLVLWEPITDVLLVRNPDGTYRVVATRKELVEWARETTPDADTPIELPSRMRKSDEPIALLGCAVYGCAFFLLCFIIGGCIGGAIRSAFP